MIRMIEVQAPASSPGLASPSDFDFDVDAVLDAIRSELSRIDLPARVSGIRVQVDLTSEGPSDPAIRITRLKSFVWRGETL